MGGEARGSYGDFPDAGGSVRAGPWAEPDSASKESDMNSRRIVVLATAVLLAVVPASTASAYAARAGYGSRALATPTPEPPGPVPVTEIIEIEPVDFGQDHCAEADCTAAPDEVEAVINVPRLVTVGTTVRVVMDQSRGFIAFWLLCVENPDGTAIYSVGRTGAPRNVVELNLTETGNVSVDTDGRRRLGAHGHRDEVRDRLAAHRHARAVTCRVVSRAAERLTLSTVRR